MGMRASWLAAAVAVGTGLSCGGGSGPPARGFDSVQLVPVRDPSLSVNGQWSQDVLLYSTVDPGDQLPRYFFLDVSTGKVQALGPDFPTTDPGTGGVNPYECAYDTSMLDHPVLTITDTRTGVATHIPDVVGAGQPCPSQDDPDILLWRRDDAGTLSLYSGPFDQLLPIPIELLVKNAISFDSKAGAFMVVAARPDAPSALGIFRVDVATGAGTPVVEPALAADAAWADGASPPPGAVLASAGLAPGAVSFADNSLLFYPRTMSDGSVVMFVGPFAQAPTELALFAIDETVAPVNSSYGAAVSFRGVWASSSDGTASNGLVDLYRAWHVTTRRLVTCTVPRALPMGIRFPLDGNRIVLGTPAPTAGLALVRPLLVMSAADPSCTLLGGDDVADVSVSYDRSTLAWLLKDDDEHLQLWVAAADGSGARKLGAGFIEWAVFISATEIELALDGDLAWLDVRDDPPQLHHIAEGVFGGASTQTTIGDWLVAAYDYSQQDQTGTLGVVSRLNGAKKEISRSVAWYWPLLAFHTDGTEPPLRIVYLVRGRNPSPQDGIWMATIPLDQFR